MRRPLSTARRFKQHGAATLIVVMVLFFVVAMVAAYTSRNLIFEQKTSANQYRSTQAFEAAEAGIEWTLAMLNGGKVNDGCGNVSPTPTASFQQRYLEITHDLASINNGGVANAVGRPIAAPDNWPACVFKNNRWGDAAWATTPIAPLCACPNMTAAAPTAPTGDGAFPAFRVWLADPTITPTYAPVLGRPGVFYLRSNGCTRMPAGGAGEQCLDFDPEGVAGDGLASLQVTVALRSALSTPPAAAITAQGGVSPYSSGTPTLRLVNRDAATNGITVNAGGAVNSTYISVDSLPGTPAELTLLGNDPKLIALGTAATPPGSLTPAERVFASQFGMRRSTYLEQPGLRRCPIPGSGSTTCTAADITALLAANPNRPIWVEGDLVLNASVGNNTTDPVLLVINGSTLTLASGVAINGFVYLTGGTAAAGVVIALPDGPTSITGALVSETSLATSYASPSAVATNQLTVTYDPVMLNLLRTTYGSWVRLPGSWKDFGN